MLLVRNEVFLVLLGVLVAGALARYPVSDIAPAKPKGSPLGSRWGLNSLKS